MSLNVQLVGTVSAACLDGKHNPQRCRRYQPCNTPPTPFHLNLPECIILQQAEIMLCWRLISTSSKKHSQLFKWEVAPECLQNLAQMGVVKSAHARASASPTTQKACQKPLPPLPQPWGRRVRGQGLGKASTHSINHPCSLSGGYSFEHTKSRTDSQQGRD